MFLIPTTQKRGQVRRLLPLADLPDRVVLAALVWGEARGEPIEGQIAVANVVRNRLKGSKSAPSWKAVCLAPEQFSCFNADDANFPKVQRAATNLMTNVPTPELAAALWIADGVMSGACPDNTHGANHYLASWLYRTKPPIWAKDAPVLAAIGGHVFVNVP